MVRAYRLVGLDDDSEHVWDEAGFVLDVEDSMRGLAELDRDLCVFGSQRLAGSEVEGDALPAPVVYE